MTADANFGAGKRASVSPRRRPLLLRLGKKLRPWLNRRLAGSSLVPNNPVLDQRDFGWTIELRAQWRQIRAELDAILQHREAVPPLDQVSPDHQRIAADGRWRSFFLVGYGHRLAENCCRAPQTAAAISRVPGLNSAFFSILEPGAHIPRHRGVTKAILTCHLGLLVPEPRQHVRMNVAGEPVLWEEGQCVVFDDSQEHEVWNETAGMRAVLLIQFRRPLNLPGRWLGSLFLEGVRRTAFVRDARRNLLLWEQAMRRSEQDS